MIRAKSLPANGQDNRGQKREDGMDRSKRVIRLTIAAAVVILGAGPSCTTGSGGPAPQGYSADPYSWQAPQPGSACSRIPPPSQC